MTATTFWVSPSRSAIRAATRRSSGRTSHTIARMKAPASAVVRTAPSSPAARAVATTNASTHQAVTSSTAAQAIVIAPTFVRRSCRSVRSGCARAPGTP